MKMGVRKGGEGWENAVQCTEQKWDGARGGGGGGGGGEVPMHTYRLVIECHLYSSFLCVDCHMR